MTKRFPFNYFRTSPEIIRRVVTLYARFPLSFRDVEDLLHERGIDVSHETIRLHDTRFRHLPPIAASSILCAADDRTPRKSVIYDITALGIRRAVSTVG